MGREDELRSIEAPLSRVVVISGIGGEGKSALAAEYIDLVKGGETEFSMWDWRDCREEGDRLRTQVLAMIERLSGAAAPLSSERGDIDQDIAEIFIRMCQDEHIVFVLDNVDAYVDLENNSFVGLLDHIVRRFCEEIRSCKMIITCRTEISYDISYYLSLPLNGLSLNDAEDLFSKRNALERVTLDELRMAHDFTKGHAFWLDLMELQVARVPGTTLSGLIENIRRGRGSAPDVLSSIWASLLAREQTILRAMAEMKRPETEAIIEKFVGGGLTYSKFQRALRSLTRLNLVVTKIERNSPDKYDLHPLVRQFVVQRFRKQERFNYIETVLKQTIIIIKGMGAILGVYLPFPMLERWSHKAELEIEAGKIQDAITTLNEAERAMIGGGHVEEYIRVARKLIEEIDWSEASNTLNNFDRVLVTLVECLDEMEQTEDADDLLTRFEQSIPTKTGAFGF